MAQLEYELESELEAESLESELEAEQLQEFETAPTADYEIIGADTRARVTNTTLAPFRYICNLEFNFPGVGAAPMCSGTLIGPTTVLTAGHCLAGRAPARMRVIPGRNGSLEPLPATRAVAFQLAPGFARGTATDYAVIQLRDPIGIRIGYWSIAHRLGPGDNIGTSISTAPLPLGAGSQKVNLSGYPADKPGTAAMRCTSPARPRNRCFHTVIGAAGRSLLCGSEQWRAYDRSVAIRGGILEYLDDTCPGHSGSPVWVRRDPSLGGRRMVAIHISRDRPPAPVANRSVLITPTVLGNIRRWLAAAPVPPPFRVLDRFVFDKADLLPAHITEIQAIARHVVALAGTPRRIRTIFLVGHTDSRGPGAFNVALGQRRALAVRTRLVAEIERLRRGLSGTLRFVVQSLGETQPVASSTTAIGRARNRRVEVLLGRI